MLAVLCGINWWARLRPCARGTATLPHRQPPRHPTTPPTPPTPPTHPPAQHRPTPTPTPAPTECVTRGSCLAASRLAGDLESAEFSALVDKYHKRYVDALVALFNEHKDKYARGEGDLTLVE
jgi:hypothetical protein